MNGTIIQTQTIELKKRLDESDDELLTIAISEFRSRYDSKSKEIIIPFELGVTDPKIKFTVPKLGEKKKLLDLSHKNVQFFKKERIDQYEKLNSRDTYGTTAYHDDEGFTDEPASTAY